jgi:hypothetical protein
MNTCAKRIFLGVVLASLGVGMSYSQEKKDPNDASLGDIARKLSAQKAKEPKPAKVFTNDNLYGSEDDVSTLSITPKETKSANSSAQEAPGTPAPVHDEAYYRAQMSTLKGTLDTHQRELDVLQQKLGQNQMQQYGNDPNKSLQQQYSRDDINKLTADIDAKKQQIADDNKAIDDLRDQLRHEGGDPGWLR